MIIIIVVIVFVITIVKNKLWELLFIFLGLISPDIGFVLRVSDRGDSIPCEHVPRGLQISEIK